MNSLHRVTQQIFRRVWLVTCFSQLIIDGVVWLLYRQELIGGMQALIAGIAGSAVSAFVVAKVASHSATVPLEAISKAILHVSPSHHGVGAPKLETIRIGRGYVTELIQQIHELANLPVDQLANQHRTQATQASDILSHLPLPVFVFNKTQQVTFATDNALSYFGVESAELFGKPLYDALDIEFSSDFTLDSWIADCQQNKATATAYWRRVRVRSKRNPEQQRQCDIAGSYNRDNSEGIEFVLTLFDHTEEYDQDDQSINFVALAVHELRTPLTIMRGYIEAFEDELHDNLNETTSKYMDRLQASARQLSGFVNNILNVARVQEHQLVVNLAEENWVNIIDRACQDMSIEARAHDKIITKDIQPNLPPVAVDRTTIYEVICNLLDNAIKYSTTSKEITISAKLNTDHMVETSIKDTGVGIPANVLPTLFEKFHRNHRNRSQISGTGLGLYISKAILDAHNGSIWVNSTEGKGSTFTFTVSPYSSLDDNAKKDNNSTMTRTAHGWIKNHSLYRK